LTLIPPGVYTYVMNIDTPDKQDKMQNRMKRLEGQVRGISRMIEEKQDPKQIIIQISAVMAGLETVKVHIVEEAMKKKIMESLENLSDLLK